MNTTLPAHDQELEQFLLWFSDQEEIPAQERLNLLNYIEEKGEIDAVAAEFIEDNLHMIELLRETRLKNTTERAKTTLGCIHGEKLSKQSAKTKIARDTEKFLQNTVEEAKTAKKTREAKQAHLEESRFHAHEIQAAKNLKEDL